MYACTSSIALIQEVTSRRFVQLSRGIGTEVTGAFACVLTRTGARTANHSLNGVISDKYEAIITADVFLDHNYLLVLQREHSKAVPPPDRADMPPSLSLPPFSLLLFARRAVFRQSSVDAITPRLRARSPFLSKDWIVVSCCR